MKDDPHSSNHSTDAELRDANRCIALGAGVGVLGTGGALASAAVCPLCVVVAPVLIGVGVVQRRRAKRKQEAAMPAPIR